MDARIDARISSGPSSFPSRPLRDKLQRESSPTFFSFKRVIVVCLLHPSVSLSNDRCYPAPDTCLFNLPPLTGGMKGRVRSCSVYHSDRSEESILTFLAGTESAFLHHPRNESSSPFRRGLRWGLLRSLFKCVLQDRSLAFCYHILDMHVHQFLRCLFPLFRHRTQDICYRSHCRAHLL